MRTHVCLAVLLVFVAGTVLFSTGSLFSQDFPGGFLYIPSNEQKPEVTPQKQEILGEGGEYTLGKGDVIEVSVRNQPEFSGPFIVGPDGTIQYTFVGDLKVEGLTKQELSELLEKELEKYVKVPEVGVTISAYRSKFIYILGEVNSPGKYPMSGDAVALRDAIMEAGLPTRNAALRRVHVITPDVEKPVCKKIDLYVLLYKGDLSDNLMLRPGDVVVVPSTVPSEINRALNQMLSPFTQASIIDEMIRRYK